MCVIGWGLLGVALSAAVAAAPGEDHAALRSLIGPDGQVTTTRHFVVVYDSTPDTVRDFTGRLEATYRAVDKFCRANNIAFDEPTELLEVVLFDRPERFWEYGERTGVLAQHLGGFYSGRLNRSAFFNNLNHPGMVDFRESIARLEQRVAELDRANLTPQQRAEKKRALKRLHFSRNRRDRFVEKLNCTIVQHEVAHHLLFNSGVHSRWRKNPKWLVEGLAQLFETPPSGRGSGIGAVNQLRLADFREACGEALDPRKKRPRKMRPEALREAYASGRFLPLRTMIGADRLYEESEVEHQSYRYAQVWGLAFYLQRTQQDELARYIANVRARDRDVELTPEEEIACFEADFGKVDEKFERRWAAFIFDLRFIPEYPNG